MQFGHILTLLRRPAFLGYALTSMFTFGCGMTYISASSFIYQNVIHTSSLLYGIGFAVNACGMVASGLISARMAGREVPPEWTVRRALPVLLTAATTFLLIAALPVPPGWLVVPLFVLMTAMGFITGNCAALALSVSRGQAGSGSAVLGGLNFLFGAAVSTVGGTAAGGTAVPVGAVLAGSAAGALLCFALARRVARAD